MVKTVSRIRLTVVLLILVLAGTAIAVGRCLPPPARRAYTSSIPHTCTFNAGDQVPPGSSKVWIQNVSGCPSGYPIFYNRTQCIYRNVIGTFWYDGPTRKGNGSSSSNYSGVTCNQYPYPSVTQVWIWYNAGLGWGGRRLF